jgi:hypothetical protein
LAIGERDDAGSFCGSESGRLIKSLWLTVASEYAQRAKTSK